MQTPHEIVGNIGVPLTAGCFMFQAIKILRTNNTDEVSPYAFPIFSIGMNLWVYYGLLINKAPVYLASGISLILIYIIIFMKIKHLVRAKKYFKQEKNN